MLYSPHFWKSHFQLAHKNEEILYFFLHFHNFFSNYSVLLFQRDIYNGKNKKKNEIQI